MNPPLRPESDRAAIEAGLMEGVIDCISFGTRSPFANEKMLGISKAPFGSSASKTMLAATYTHLVVSGKDTLARWLELVISILADYRIDRGVIAAGKKANITLIDPNSSCGSLRIR
jgi:dihydroorotase